MNAKRKALSGQGIVIAGVLGAGVWWLNRNGMLDAWNERLRTTLFGSDTPSARGLDESHAHTSADARTHGVYEPEFAGSVETTVARAGGDAEVHGVFEAEFAGGGQS